jgi:hypothetical protein
VEVRRLDSKALASPYKDQEPFLSSYTLVSGRFHHSTFSQSKRIHPRFSRSGVQALALNHHTLPPHLAPPNQNYFVMPTALNLDVAPEAKAILTPRMALNEKLGPKRKIVCFSGVLLASCCFAPLLIQQGESGLE